MELERFALDDDAGFRARLQGSPRAIVLLRGEGCPYSATFERVFRERAPPDGWILLLRMVEEGGRGPVGEALGVEITPTVVAFDGGTEVARLPGRLLLGIPRTAYARWLKALAGRFHGL